MSWCVNVTNPLSSRNILDPHHTYGFQERLHAEGQSRCSKLPSSRTERPSVVRRSGVILGRMHDDERVSLLGTVGYAVARAHPLPGHRLRQRRVTWSDDLGLLVGGSPKLSEKIYGMCTASLRAN